jgi:rare lipoprotein A
MIRFFVFAAFLLTLSGCAEVEYASHLAKTTGWSRSASNAEPGKVGQGGNFKIGNPYKIDGRWYYPKEQYEMTETGIISWYGPGFHNKKTANGEIFNKHELTAAHRTLQMPSLVRVTNLENGKSIIVRVNDRGPYKRGRVMDVSERAAELLGFKSQGTAKAKIEVLKKESWHLAQAAKNGQSTQGVELAFNEGGGGFQPASYEPALGPGDVSYRVASVQTEPLADLPPPIEPVSREMLVTPGPQPGMNSMVPGHVDTSGAFYPDPVVSEFPVRPTGIYVQAGAFSVADNAHALSARLSNFRHAEVYPAMVNGRQFYRVRLGPLSNVEEADELLARVIQGGADSAIIVVE